MKTHLISIIALNESELPPLDSGHIFDPEQLSQHFDWQAIGLMFKPLEGGLKHHPSVFYNGFESTSLETYWIPNLGRVVVLTSETTADPVHLGDLNIFQYWRECETLIRSDWRPIMLQNQLPDIDWVFSFAILDTDQDALSAVPNRSIEISLRRRWQQSDGLSAVIDWNGALILNAPTQSNASRKTLVGIVSVISIQWQVDLMTIKTLRTLLCQDKSRREQHTETLQVARLARRSNLSQVRLLSIYVNNHLIPRMFRDAWAMDQFKEQVNSTIQRIATINEIESNIRSSLSNSKQERLLFLISLTGVSGTMAAVIATVDFKNAFISSESWRFVLVAFSAIAIALLAYLNPRNRQ